jgi:dUTP pyrophosphatase
MISNWQTIPITKSDNRMPTPCHETPGAAGMDLAAAHDIEVWPGETVLVDTGIAFNIPEGYFLDVRQRSGLSIHYPNYLANSPGVIDSDYRGTIKAIIINNTQHRWQILKGDRIIQVILMAYMPMRLQTANYLTPTKRGEKGFGSTGGVNILKELEGGV